MNSRDRVLAALGGQPQAGPPFTLTLSLYGARLTGCPLAEYYRNPNRYAEGQQAVMALCNPDILFGPFALCLEAEAFGSQLIFLHDNPPNIRKPAASGPEDFLRIPPPDIDAAPGLRYLRESVRRMAERYAGRTPLCGVITAPVDLPAIVMGIERWLETLLVEPEAAAAVMEAGGWQLIARAKAGLSDGADFIGLTTVFSNPAILFRKQIDDLILPALRQSFQAVKGPIVFHHGGNPMVPFLRDYLDLPNVAAFAVDHRDDLAGARGILGPGRLLLGNLNGPALSRTPAADVLRRVDQILEDRKGDPCFIFASSGADVPWDTPPELIQAIAERIRGARGEA